MSFLSSSQNSFSRSLALLSLLAAALPSGAQTSAPPESSQSSPSAAGTPELHPFVVFGSRATSPLESVFDPGAPAQPLPAQDGADVLKSVPGFAVIRKGGTDGDPVLRGMAGSRLGVQADGQVCLGGCGSRMDPPTAYIFPAAYDRVRVLKGPQTVAHGPGQSAGVVLFEVDTPAGAARPASLETHATAGSWGRLDLAAEALAGLPSGFASLNLTRTASGDYEDGDGNTVHSHHERWSAHGSLGWTPDNATLVQFSAIASDGEAAYADRMMDGVKFDRTGFSLRARRDQISPLLARAEIEIGLNEVDHVMDNYSLRAFTPTMMMPQPSVSNPDRRTVLARARFDLILQENLTAVAGLDHQADRHRVRGSMNQNMMPYEDQTRVTDAEFSQVGLFTEITWQFAQRRRLAAGFRLDRWSARDERSAVNVSMMSSLPNPTAGAEREATLPSGFLRVEQDLDAGQGSFFAGIGHVARFLDYWELIKNESPGSVSAFLTDPERTTQIDLGLTRRFGPVELTAAAFASRVDDFALVQNGFIKPSGMMGTRQAVVTRSIAADTWGGEAAAVWQPHPSWRVDASLAYTRGENQTDDRPLAQIAPFDSRLGLTWMRADWSAGALLRAVASQDRVAIGQGNIVGQDLGPTDGFTTLACHAAWTPAAWARLSAGIDNLFDAAFAEHLSRGGAMVPGYPPILRLHEPGRTFWTRLDLRF